LKGLGYLYVERLAVNNPNRLKRLAEISVDTSLKLEHIPHYKFINQTGGRWFKSPKSGEQTI